MDTVKGVLAILTLLLGALSFLLFIQLSAANAQLALANELSGNTLKLLKGQSATNCGTISTDFQRINNCIKPLLLTNDFKEDTFAQPDAKKATVAPKSRQRRVKAKTKLPMRKVRRPFP